MPMNPDAHRGTPTSRDVRPLEVQPSERAWSKLTALHRSCSEPERVVLGQFIARARLREHVAGGSDFEPTEQQVGFFREQGYLCVPGLTGDAEISRLRGLFAHVLEEALTRQSGGPDSTDGTRAHADRMLRTQSEGSSLRYSLLLQPELRHPELLETMAFRHAKKLACALLGIDPAQLTDFASVFSVKPPRVGVETPWHQEEAYWDNVNWLGNYLIVWMPMDPVSENSGCLQFIPGSHHGDVHRHRWEPQKPLTVDEPFDVGAAVACPVPPGSATVHHCRTLHYAGPNRTTLPRRVWLLAFHGPPFRRDRPAARPWLGSR